MSKRSHTFARRKQDAYYTPYEAVIPLLPHLPYQAQFTEPCAGDGRLVRHLERHGHKCVYWSDISEGRDALKSFYPLGEYIITNPPWTRTILHPMIEHFAQQHPTWLLFDADWAHTKQAAPYLVNCRKIVSVGRVSWMENGTSGLDNCAWYLFEDTMGAHPTEFIARTVDKTPTPTT